MMMLLFSIILLGVPDREWEEGDGGGGGCPGVNRVLCKLISNREMG